VSKPQPALRTPSIAAWASPSVWTDGEWPAIREFEIASTNRALCYLNSTLNIVHQTSLMRLALSYPQR
jgi:hypothetical protein